MKSSLLIALGMLALQIGVAHPDDGSGREGGGVTKTSEQNTIPLAERIKQIRAAEESCRVGAGKEQRGRLKNDFCDNLTGFYKKSADLPEVEYLTSFAASDCRAPLSLDALFGDGRNFDFEMQRLLYGCDLSEAKNGAPEMRCPLDRMPVPCEGQVSDFMNTGTAKLKLDGARCIFTFVVDGTFYGPDWVARVWRDAFQKSLTLPSSFGEEAMANSKAVAFYQAAYNRVELERLSAILEFAKRIVVKYLEGQTQAAVPKSLISRIQDTKLLETAGFFKRDATEQDKYAAQVYLAACGGTILSGTADNAFALDFDAIRNSPIQGRRIAVCPNVVAGMRLTGARAVLGILLHELGHMIDPCVIGSSFSKALDQPGIGCQDLPASQLPIDQERYAFFARSLDTASCLMTNAGVKGLFTAYATTWFDSLESFIKPEASQASCDRQIIRRFQSPKAGGYGFLSACPNAAVGMELYKFMGTNSKFSKFNKVGTSKEELAAIGKQFNEEVGRRLEKLGIEGGDSAIQSDQSQEAFADFIASQTLAEAIADPAYRGLWETSGSAGELNPVAEILTSISWFARSKAPPITDGHPAPVERLRIFSSSPSIRSALGCGTSVATACHL